MGNTVTVSDYSVTGMVCQHCVSAVTRELSALAGVTDVQVDLTAGRVTVTSDGPLDAAEVGAALDEAGYDIAPESSG